MTPTRRSCRCFPLLILFAACLQLPLPPLSAVDGAAAVGGDANSTDSCNILMPCVNLGRTNMYPFGVSAACAASPSYVLSNCTPSSTASGALWDSFSDAASGVVGSPVVTDVTPFVYGARDEAIFRLYWNKSPVGLGSCPPLYSSTNLSLYNIPSSINLTRPADNFTLNFTSDSNTILLFNCSFPSIAVQPDLGVGMDVDNRTCSQYKDLCGGLSNMSCVSGNVTSSPLQLQLVLDNLACSHFMFGIFNPSLYDFSSQNSLVFSPAVFELLWKDMRCLHYCTGAGEYCVRDEVIPQKFKYCQSFDYGPFCYGGRLKCSTRWKVGVGVSVGVVATVGFLGICVLIRVGFRRYSNVFINVAVPVVISAVISILKRMLRKLQWISYRLKRPGLDLVDLEGLTERLTEYSYGSIASATKSFSNLVGEGGFGRVYRGTLTTKASKSHGGGSEEQIAVKVLEAKSKHSKKQFLNEVATIGKIHHVNVVRLLGFCMQEDHDMLVYEFVENGSLDKWLFSKKENDPQEHVLDWGQRFSIALGVARGLSYLHEECRHRTVHCDIKPQNILLDADMHPKIADFGLARLMSRDESKVVTFAKGTPGYIAPEFWRGGESQLSTKFDVYSYGMVLLELISGHRNFDARVMENGSPFPAMAFEGAMEGDLESIVDPRVNNTSEVDEARKQVQWQQMKTVVCIALWCIQEDPVRRPLMSEVMKYLEGGATVSQCPPQPAISVSCAPYPEQEFVITGSHQDNECTPLSTGR